MRPAADAENIAVASAVMDLPQMIDFIDWQVHFFDFAILGALQIDRFGNINTVCVGDHARPRLRGPGTVGISALCGLSRRFYIMMTRHDRGSLRAQGRFHLRPRPPARRHLAHRRGLPEGGPRLVRDAARRVRFRAGEQGDAHQVAASRRHARRRCATSTGFDLVVPDEIAAAPRCRPPTRSCSCCAAPSTRPACCARKFPWPEGATESRTMDNSMHLIEEPPPAAAPAGAPAWSSSMSRRSPSKIDESNRFPEELVEVFGDMGLLQLWVPSEYGGPGADLTSVCIAKEEIAKVSESACAAGRPATRSAWSCRSCISAPRSRSAAICRYRRQGPHADLRRHHRSRHPAPTSSSMKTQRGAGRRELGAQRRQDASSPSARVAHCILVFARTSEGRGVDGISRLHRRYQDAGILLRPRGPQDGHPRRAQRADVLRQSARARGEHDSAPEGQAFKTCMRILDLNRPTIGAISVGLGARARSTRRSSYGQANASSSASRSPSSRASSSCSPTWQIQTRGGALRCSTTARRMADMERLETASRPWPRWSNATPATSP